MNILLINPNTNTAMTGQVLDVARAAAAPGTALTAVTARLGAAAIHSRSSYAIAAHAALDAWAHADDGSFDAVVLACFGDPGLEGLRELCPLPVIGMADAAIGLAVRQGRRFGIVTGGERWKSMLEEFVASRGMSARLASIQTVAPTGGEIARDPEGAMALLVEACIAAAGAGADHVILGGAGLAGLAARMQPLVPVPLIDGTVAAIAAAEAAVTATAAGFDPPPAVGSQGLSPALARKLSRL